MHALIFFNKHKDVNNSNSFTHNLSMSYNPFYYNGLNNSNVSNISHNHFQNTYPNSHRNTNIGCEPPYLITKNSINYNQDKCKVPILNHSNNGFIEKDHQNTE